MTKEHPVGNRGRVILVNPGIHFYPVLKNMGMFPNNAIQILGTILHQNQFDVHIVDGRYLSVEDAIRQVRGLISEDLIFVGFSVMTIQLTWAYLVSCGIKDIEPNVKIIWGGVHPTLFPEQTAMNDSVDICVVNECAGTIVQLADVLVKKENLSKVNGICYKDNDQAYSTAPNQIPDDFTNIPYIDFSIMNHEVYSRNNNIASDSSLNEEYRNDIVYPVNASLGCNFSCNFCINVILGRKYKMRSAEEVVERIEYLKSEYGANYIHLVDENFFGSKKRIYRFVELLLSKKLNIKWRPQLRADYFNDSYINEEFIKELERSGMVIAVMGVESASQETLDRLNKKLKVESITKALEILSTTRIIPRLSFMAGMPGETEEEISKTYQFAVDLKEKFPTCEPLVTPFRLFPGSNLYDLAVNEYGYKPPKSLIEWAEVADKEYSEAVGYQNTKHYPWIVNTKKFEARHKIFTLFRITSWSLSPHATTRDMKGKIKHFTKLFFCKTSAMRIKKDFYSLNIEYFMLELLRKIRMKIQSFTRFSQDSN
ncbi:MAG: B12-binding domain-containing radical SAM protein [Planctomycetes bacterium]|nr:B12-binding domain-containing radical SAM protein [Planctomycetota bacterium]